MDATLPSLKRLSLSLTLALLTIVALTAGLNSASAQNDAPAVRAVSPAPNSVSVDPAALISVTFNTSPTAITSRTFRVRGSLSGLLSGTLSYDAASRTATFDPAQDFKPGELVAVGLTSATHYSTGTISLAAPYGWSFTARASHGSARFIRSPGYNVNAYPYAVYGADLDGDGDVDLVTASAPYNTVSILLNDGRGAFSAASPRDYVVGNYPQAVRGADLDDDGDVDLVTANRADDTISVLLNDGDGHFTPATPRNYAVGNYPNSVCLADLDGDGDVDAVTTNLIDDSLSVLSNDGNGAFTPFSPRDYAVGNGPEDVSCVDLDGDGDIDLITANFYSDDVSLLLNNGAGSFVPANPRDYSVGDGPWSVWSADLDDDGDVDLATVNSYADSVSILLNLGGHFSSTVSGDLTVHDSPRSIQGADLDGDGDLDLVTANAYSDDVSVLLNDGSGVFTPATPRDYAVGRSPYSVYAADLDGDADLDLAVADYSASQVFILLNFGLQVKKTALTPSSWPGQPVTYTLGYTNHDAGTIRGAIITDHIPISLTDVHYARSGPVITPTGGLTYAWQVAPLPPGATGVITVSAIVSPALSADEYVYNYAVIAHHGQQLTDTAALFVDATPELWLNASVAPLPSVKPGQRFTYTIQANVSGALSTSGWLTGALPAGTHFVTATPGYAPASPRAGETITWPLPSGIHYPPSTLQYTLVLTSDGPSRLLSYQARAVYPGVITASAQAGIWLWNGDLPDACPRDIALVLDRSGSMQEETRCYGCFDQYLKIAYPLPFGYHCDQSAPLTFQGYKYISIEAEHYSRYLEEADYHKDWTEFPKTWWAMQRQPNRSSSGPDNRGAWMMVGPHSGDALHYPTLNDIRCPPDMYTTPRLDYDFTVPTAGAYYVWIRAQGGSGNWANGEARRSVHVGLNGAAMATGYTPNYGPYNDGASSSAWRWTRVPEPNNLQANQTYTLNFWAAGPGFRLDKIVLTNDTRTNLMDNGYPLDWDFPNVSDAGPVETHGRTGWACLGPGRSTPDPRFEPVNPDGTLDDLYDDKQPIGAAKEAAAKFVRSLNKDLDQISYVWYSTNANIREELYCVKQYGSCPDFERVVDAIESTSAAGSTNIAQALWYGLSTLIAGQEPALTGQGLPPAATGRTHYGRSETYGALVLITDGQPNVYPSLPTGYGDCYSDDLWPDQPDESDSQRRSRECVVWFAQHARDLGIAVYTVGLGSGADHELLAYVAELTGALYYVAPDAKDLEGILDDIEADSTSNCFLSGVDVAKRVTPWPSVAAGERLTYTIETTLSGWIRTSPLWLYDDLPSQTVLITATPGYMFGTALTQLAWPLPSGTFTQPLNLTHTIVVSAPRESGVLTNHTWVADDYFAPNFTFASDSVTVTVNTQPEPAYGLAKLVQPSAVVTVGQRVTYTLLVTTNRPDLPVTLGDTLPPGTAFISASGDHAPAAPGPGDTLTWPLSADDFSHGELTRTLTLLVTDSPPGGVLTNQATVAGVSASVDLAILAQPTYQLHKMVEPASPITVGQRITYTLVVTTNRPDLPVTLGDTLPPGTAFISASGDHAPAAPGPGDTLTWPLAAADLDGGVAQRILTLDVTHIPADNLLANNAAVADAHDSVILTVLPELVPLPDLLISHVSHQPGQPAPAQTIHFLVSVHNQGDAAVPGWLAVELYAKDSRLMPAGPPAGPADHAGGWCADPPACDQTRPAYLAFFYGLAAGKTVTLPYYIALGEAGGYQVYAQVDVNRVGGANDTYGASLESDEGNNVFDYGLLNVLGWAAYKLYLPLIEYSRD